MRNDRNFHRRFLSKKWVTFVFLFFSSVFMLYMPGKVRIINSYLFEVTTYRFLSLAGRKQVCDTHGAVNGFFPASVERSVAGSEKETCTDSLYLASVNNMR